MSDGPQLPGDWRGRLDEIVETMRAVSRERDPQEMIRLYGQRIAEINPVDGFLSVSRRDLQPPWYRIARSTRWEHQPNPWKQRDELPVFQGGLLGEMIYSNRPHIFHDLEVDPEDPAREYMEGYRSLICIPSYDEGESRNIVVQMRREPNAFDAEQLPQMVWMTNLIGRATHNLVLSEQLRTAQERIEKQLETVGRIQRSLLPARIPKIPGMELAAHYEASQQAGGDYYDLFELADGSWGILIADVSGHGTPAAVLMAITHALAHLYAGPPAEPGRMLAHLNDHLAARYTNGSGNFVTAFYGIYRPEGRTLNYASAGHPPARLKHCNGPLDELDAAAGLPLGIFPNREYTDATVTLKPDDLLTLYTDGITEARNPAHELFGTDRMDQVFQDCGVNAHTLAKRLLAEVQEFANGRPPDDDRTLLVARIS